MRKNFGSKAIITPLPVLIIATYNEDGSPNAMNAAWGGQREENQIAICLSTDHKTTENIKQRKAFTVSFGTRKTEVISDFLGIVSGNKMPDKVSKSSLHVIKSSHVDAPMFEEYPLTLECELLDISGDIDGSTYLVGKVVNTSADESVLDEQGKVDLGKVEPISYDSSAHAYRVLGEKVGKAFSDGKSILKNA